MLLDLSIQRGLSLCIVFQYYFVFYSYNYFIILKFLRLPGRFDLRLFWELRAINNNKKKKNCRFFRNVSEMNCNTVPCIRTVRILDRIFSNRNFLIGHFGLHRLFFPIKVNNIRLLSFEWIFRSILTGFFSQCRGGQ